MENQNNTNGVSLGTLLLTLNIFHTYSSFPIANFEQLNASWGGTDSIQTIMNDNDDVIIARSYVFDETLCFSFRKDNVDHISEAGLAADTTKI